MAIMGISPSYPETGYGYIKAGFDQQGATDKVFTVLEFVEKPQIEKAAEYVASGQYLWNSGIITGSMDCILNSVKNLLPEMYEKLLNAVTLPESAEKDSLITKVFSEIDSISFDVGVLEKSKNICVVKGDFEWFDLGSLGSLDKVLDIDLYGNAVSGAHFGIDTRDSVIYSNSGITATIGLENMIITNTGDIVFACPKERAQEVRQLVELLKQCGHGEFA
jgi:mannose-1-phosphate guanylyltransferase